ncbi:U32 family peptidase [Caloramator sp. Dgby_cultured_2]|nr:U32 family peptidase [Caloramator sp. Dgby_cultured_2]WDU84544.1 U32 family peptidase [Caloramator sp. Dgby_cultured_2]
MLNSFCPDTFENEGVYLSQELNLLELKDLISKTNKDTIVFVYGRTRMMVSRHCPIGSEKGYSKLNCPKVCEDKIHYLKDRMGEKFLIATDLYCRSHIFNSKITIMLEHIKDLISLNSSFWVMEFLEEDAKFSGEVVKAYKDALTRGLKGDFSLSSGTKRILEENKNKITKGHFYRGIL